ncbi:hypothetical protein BABINDRAFT_8901 [Babjeviella inositovora NRRL Y-12698]|uniref:Pre-mRNA-splicing factor SLU7 n=1 Tax=Babjeviella inositovora NRRL Y-12698 TaxID=984486 RepID=A0A1E3QLW8_9ASCO|nr:uncharacterized protein BABINDRAFT_8901 [Babjeviella inositovora NRRL Y-12698]ODQ78650.1 hypothetical protein BABINDRAFT_8901 [Babjeviella inositovora NRRL Y-12698]
MPPKELENSNSREVQYDASGNKINPFIPQFISNAPWYMDQDNTDDPDDYLRHQRLDPALPVVSHTEPVAGKGIVEEVVQHVPAEVIVKKFPKGSCSNCGSMKHKRMDCLERPRKQQNSSTVRRAAPHISVKRNEDYDSKRDRWFGYDTQDWDDRAKVWEDKELAKVRQEIADRVKLEEEKFRKASATFDDFSLEMAELGLIDDFQVGTTYSTGATDDTPTERAKKTIRDRYDQPSYLSNLEDPLSYDPKSRITIDKNKGFINDRSQFVKYLTGEAAEYERTKHFAWEKDKRQSKQQHLEQTAAAFIGGLEDPDGPQVPVADINLNPEASPTAVLLAAKKAQEEKERVRQEKKRKLLEMYGGGKHMK